MNTIEERAVGYPANEDHGNQQTAASRRLHLQIVFQLYEQFSGGWAIVNVLIEGTTYLGTME